MCKIESPAGELSARVGSIVTNRTDPAEGIVRFCTGRGSCEQWIKEDKHARQWRRLSCHQFRDNALRLALFVLACNLANFLRRPVVQMAEVSILPDLVGRILRRTGRRSPVPT